MKRNLLISFGVSASLLAMPLTFAYALDLTENITLVLPSDSTSFTLDSGAKFNTLGINNSSFDLTLDSGDIITIHDSSKRALTNSRNIDTICDSTESRITHSVASSSGASITITTTPSGTCASSTAAASGGGGGGGGGGGSSGSSVSVTTTTSPSPSPSASASPAAMTSPAVASALSGATTPSIQDLFTPSNIPSLPPVIIARTLILGSRTSDVTSLQSFLARDPSIYPEGIVSGYFGPKTVAAVKRFQEKYGIAKKGQAGYGIVGPKTRAKIKEVSAMSFSVSAPDNTAPTPSTSPTISALQAQIKMLQDMINKLRQR